ncbi:MAG: cyclic-di-AMP receptor [Clostridiales bacterium]|nr:cyclic-di-AMP receptor [Clostridiales bacterium]
MKLVMAIVHDDDAHRLIRELNSDDFSVTKLSSTGGFLKSGNTTLLIGVSKDKVDNVLDIIKKNCQTRKELISITPVTGDAGFISVPMEVNIGGATIFVLDVENNYKF